MSQTLASKYRPAAFDDLVGQPFVSTPLKLMVEQMRVPSGLLFSGTRGTGKTSTARILAASVLCQRNGPDLPCTLCENCLAIADGTSLNLVEIDAASHGSVAEVRDLIESLRFGVGGTHRFIVLDEAHSMSKEAFNTLLKTLEDPPSGTIFILVTTEPEKLPDTIVSRLIELVFKKLPPAAIFDRLVTIVSTEQITLPLEVLQFIADRADGSLRDAIMSLELASLSGVSDLSEYRQLIGHHDVAPRLIGLMETGNAANVFQALDQSMELIGDPHQISSQLIHTFRDLLILHSGGELNLSGPALDVRQLLKGKLDVVRIVGALKLLWDLKTKIRVADDPRGSLELAIMLTTELLSRGKQQEAKQAPVPVVAVPPAAPASEPQKLSLSELQ